MITKHSIDLTRIKEPCFGETQYGGCTALRQVHAECGSYKCPFYKPKMCKSWVRIKDRQGVNLIPPEEAFGRSK